MELERVGLSGRIFLSQPLEAKMQMQTASAPEVLGQRDKPGPSLSDHGATFHGF